MNANHAYSANTIKLQNVSYVRLKAPIAPTASVTNSMLHVSALYLLYFLRGVW